MTGPTLLLARHLDVVGSLLALESGRRLDIDWSDLSRQGQCFVEVLICMGLMTIELLSFEFEGLVGTYGLTLGLLRDQNVR